MLLVAFVAMRLPTGMVTIAILWTMLSRSTTQIAEFQQQVIPPDFVLCCAVLCYLCVDWFMHRMQSSALQCLFVICRLVHALHAVKCTRVPFCSLYVFVCVCRAKSSYTSTWCPMVTGDLFSHLANIAGTVKPH